MTEIPNIIIIEDHPVVSEGLVEYFNKTGRWNVAGTASSVAAAKDLLSVTSAHIILLDIQLEDGWGLDIIPWLAEQTKLAERVELETPNDCSPLVAVYSAFDDYAHVNAALSLGVKAYITKRRGLMELENALLKTFSGETYIDDTAQTKLLNTASGLNILTIREKEIFSLVKTGLPNRQIAARLGISYRTVENILSCVYDKFGIRSRYELERL